MSEYHRLAKLSTGKRLYFCSAKISTDNFFLLRKKYVPLTIPLRRCFLLVKAVKHKSERQIFKPQSQRPRKGAV